MSDTAAIAEVTDQNFEALVLQSDTPVVVDFWAEWCGPCRQIAPIIDAIANEYGDQIKVCKMNVDDSPRTPSKYGVLSIPTVLAFKDGQVVQELKGFRPKAAFDEMISGLL